MGAKSPFPTLINEKVSILFMHMKNFRLKNTLFAIIFVSITVSCERGLYENENKKENGIIKKCFFK